MAISPAVLPAPAVPVRPRGSAIFRVFDGGWRHVCFQGRFSFFRCCLSAAGGDPACWTAEFSYDVCCLEHVLTPKDVELWTPPRAFARSWDLLTCRGIDPLGRHLRKASRLGLGLRRVRHEFLRATAEEQRSCVMGTLVVALAHVRVECCPLRDLTVTARPAMLYVNAVLPHALIQWLLPDMWKAGWRVFGRFASVLDAVSPAFGPLMVSTCTTVHGDEKPLFRALEEALASRAPFVADGSLHRLAQHCASSSCCRGAEPACCLPRAAASLVLAEADPAREAAFFAEAAQSLTLAARDLPIVLLLRDTPWPVLPLLVRAERAGAGPAAAGAPAAEVPALLPGPRAGAPGARERGLRGSLVRRAPLPGPRPGGRDRAARGAR